jgi:LysR family transcriptional regulator for metE and metH
MNHLEIKHLRMICAIAESSNMTRAAEKLCITQSALSQQLKDIESKLEIALFFRTRKKMILTEVGKQLLDTAVEVLGAVDRAERKISRKMKGEKGELKVGTQCIFCYKWLPQVMQSFHAKFPHIEIEVGNSVDLIEELEVKKYDLIISGAIAPSEVHTAVPLFKDQLVCIMPKDHPLAACSFIQLDDFTENNLLSYTEKNKNRFYQLVLKPKGIEPKKIMNVGAPQAIIEMVLSGFGISIFPRWAVSEAMKTLPIVARPITTKGFPLTWHAVSLTNSHMPIYQKEFIRSISSLNVTGQSILADRLSMAR